MNASTLLPTLDAVGTMPYTVLFQCTNTVTFQSDIIDVRVSITLENEYDPMFTHSSVEASFPEDLRVGNVLVSVNATDDDLGLFGTINYTLGSGSDIFRINSNGDIILAEPFNFDINNRYIFIVTASNPPVPGTGVTRQSEVSVTINVLDIDDESPTFTQQNYLFSVHETVLPNFPRPAPGFETVSCTDPDSDNTRITYTIVAGEDPGPFVLNGTTGSLSVTTDLDYENRTSYVFSVMCYDNSVANHSGRARVDIAVLSVDEFDTEIVNNPTRTLLLQETLAVGSVVAIVSPNRYFFLPHHYLFSDADAGPDGNITYTLSEEQGQAGDSRFFNVDLLTGEVTLRQEIDFDNPANGFSASFDVIQTRVTGCDVYPVPESSDCQNVLLSFIAFAVNEFRPTIAQSEYSVTLSELTVPGTVILQGSQVNCMDMDLFAGGLQSIGFSNPGPGIEDLFFVSEDTGQVATTSTLDYETAPSHGFELQCSDGSFTTRATVVVTVVPENDNIPVFETDIYRFNVSRTTPANRYPVGQVFAADADVDFGGDLTYSIDSNGHFEIADNGEILLFNSVFNRSGTFLSARVSVSDGLNMDDALVIFNLTDGNLNRPVFQLGSRAFEVSELSPIDTSITDVFCNDTETGLNGEIRYSIGEGNNNNAFSVDAITGELTVRNTLILPLNTSFEEYELRVSCSDLGVPSLSDSVVIFIRVFQDDSSPPVIANDTIIAFVNEDVPINTVVVTVQASDIDSNQLEFRLLNQSVPGVFIIGPSTGSVQTAAALDREEISMYRMTVEVTEVRMSAGPERSDRAELIIFVRDANDNRPVCDNTMLAITIPETLVTGESIIQLNCSDEDIGVNGQLDYSLEEDFGVLEINTNGEISLRNFLNNTELNILVASVYLSDEGFPTLSNIYQVTIFISSINRNIPTFINLPSSIMVSEAQPLQEILFTVDAHDPDRGSFGRLSYTIVDREVDSPFGIFPNTGGLFLTRKLNFFSQRMYTLNISVADSDYLVTERLEISVLDANEFTPVCESVFITNTILENLPPSVMLADSLSCSDDDDGSNGELMYTIESGNTDTVFEIRDDGTVYTVRPLDFETIQSYDLLVGVSDGGSPPRAVNVTMRIVVQPVNEFIPTFAIDFHQASVSEDARVGTSILNVTATDLDSSSHSHGQVSYTIVGLIDPLFSISNDGVLQVSGNLNRETQDMYIFMIQANDQGSPQFSSMTMINITITDVDDNPPQFTQPLYFTVLNGTTDSGTPVTSVQCMDDDIGSNAVIFYALDSSSADSQFFSISNAGQIEVVVSLPVSRGYSITVRCVGPAPMNRTDTAVVSIQVLVDSTISFQPSARYNTSVDENAMPVRDLLSIAAISSTGASLTYQLLNGRETFAISRTSGTLQLISSLDYEMEQLYVLRVQASDSGDPPNLAEAVVEVQVNNINDESPEITSPVTEISLMEGPTTLPLIVGEYNCSDEDDEVFGEVRFRIRSGNLDGTFAISTLGTLQLVSTLDYETRRSYSLQIVCEDGGTPIRSDVVTVPINVLPINDNAPDFGVNVIHITANENLPQSSPAGVPVVARDNDLPPHNDVRYSIIGNTDPPIFTISSTTGQITLMQTLDYESVTSYSLVILAVDSGGDSTPDYDVLNDTVTVEITVQDVNDNVPMFSSGTYTGTVEEGAGSGSQVVIDAPTISCSDLDSNENGRTSLSISSDLFSIQDNGIVTVTGSLDFETRGSHFLTLQCQDNGASPRSTETSLVITVTDVDEFGPRFVNSSYRFTIPESTAVGSPVGTVLADDLDAGEFGTVSYSLSNTTASPFSVDSETGVITLTDTIDYETQARSYIVTVSASDNAGNSDLATVVINVLNVDDNNPVFTLTDYFISISESSSLDTSAGRVSCSDADNIADGIPVTYGLISSLSNNPFTIDSQTGTISVIGTLDLEAVPRYIIRAVCYDSAGKNTTSGVTIDLEPFNDFLPIFVGAPYSTTLLENTAIGTSVFQVTAVDDDNIRYNIPTYSITGGNTGGRFSVDPANGIIRVNQAIDRETLDQYILQIQAQNVIPPTDTSGSPSLSSSTTINITILDQNDNSPIISPSDPPSVFIPEADGPSAFVADFECTDPDFGANSTTSFTISSARSSNNFEIYENGTLVTTEILRTNVVVEVTCSDRGSPPRTTTVSIVVNAVSMNDHPPRFSTSATFVGVPEDTAVGVDIMCFTATDQDGPDTPDGVIHYTLNLQRTSSPDVSRFGIRENTGCIFVSLALNFDINRFYSYNIIATDMGEEPMSGRSVIFISVVDVVQDPPTFVNTPYTQSIFETAEGGTRVVQIQCTDTDVNDTISYNITSGNDNELFSIDVSTGEIEITRTLDYETSTSHTLSVVCVDSYDLSDTTEVFVNVVPINEHTPSFSSRQLEIAEHSSVAVITQLEWVDLDAGPDGEVEFNIISGNIGNAFQVDSQGRVIVRGNVDREVLDFYSLEIMITDQSTELANRRFSMNVISITITDINDHTPQFESDPYLFGPLNGNENIGHFVGNVTCTDNDIGTNAEVTYQLVENSTQLFSVDATTGHVNVSGDLSTREFDNVTFFVECVNLGSLPRSGMTRVAVAVEEVNIHAPEFVNTSYFAEVAEDIPIIEYTILTIQANDRDAGINGQVRYRLQDDLQDRFFIDDETGSLSVLRSLDFERETEYNLTVEAIDGAVDSPMRLTSSVLVRVAVTGVNEFTPICDDPVYVMIINKTTQGELIDFGCIDGDAGVDGALMYNITLGNGESFFDVTTDGRLIVPTPIVPDTKNEQFSLEISVTDQGTPSRETTIEAIIIYSFDNLDAPTFNETSYVLTVSELIEVGQIVARFVAEDTDPSLQGQIVYRLVGTDHFRIDSVQGDLFVAQPLDWESEPVVSFSIVAADSDPYQPRSGFASITVTVVNENDNRPQCNQSFYTVQVLSTAPIGTTLLELNCTDADENPLVYQFIMTQTRQASSFMIDSNTGKIFVAGPLTPSTTTVLSVRISGDDGEQITVTISIQTLFSNIEAPTFGSSVFSFAVEEDTLLLSNIGSIQATDSDSSVLDLTYTIVNPDQYPEFYVNPVTGDILLTSPLDYETVTEYSFSVLVQDSGSFDASNQLNDTAMVVINVTNTNDNIPVLSSGGLYGQTVSETTPVNTTILTITCTDSDLPPFTNPVISSSGFASTPFELVSQGPTTSAEAVVMVSQPLSGSSSYVVNVTCADEGGISVQGQVFIYVPEPLAPVFSQTSYEWLISENANVSSVFTLIGAISNDGSEITYSFVEGNEDDIFYIYPSNGEVSLVTSLDYETQRRHGLIVRAVDGANRQASVLLLVQVLDVNDEVPLTPPSALLRVNQNSPVGFPVGVLECTDRDAMDEDMTLFNFTFIPQSDIFNVDDRGVVRVARLLDDSPVYVLPVICFDVSDPQSVSTGVVTIEVDFVNQFPPEFEFPLYSVSVREDIRPLDLVADVLATDRDVGSFGEVTYSISAGNPDQFFIQASTGRIGLLTSLDRETQDSYLVTVLAVDGGLSASESSRMTGTSVVSIIVQDANDNPPVPDQLSYVQSIITNHTLLSPVLTVQCSDLDFGDNGIVDYSLAPNLDDFVIQTNGTILLARQQANQGVYSFIAVCTDRGTPVLSSSALVTVTVDIISLSAPVFDQLEYNVTISETTSIGSIILRVTAMPSDPSIGIAYFIESGNEAQAFHISLNNGDIIVRSELDASVQQTYTLTVRATTTGRSALSSFATVQILVTDINDNIPQFTRSLYTASINETIALLSPVVQVQCNDVDIDAEISYLITDGQTRSSFNITTEGLISVASEIDFEIEQVHTLTVTCTDGGETPRTATSVVRIEVLPLNEFIPQFTSSVYNFVAAENSFGTSIGRIQATDEDSGIDGNVTYLLQDPGNFLVVFVDPLSGDVLVANNLDYETQTFWNLTVIAQDGGGAESHATLNIQVLNVNDVNPVLSPATTIVAVSAASPIGFPIQSYLCSDADGSGTTLTIANGNNMGYFILSNSNVLLWSGLGSDLTADAVVSLSLRCQDGRASSQFVLGNIAIHIQVMDIEPPVFSQAEYQTAVVENSPNGTSVLTAVATGPNPGISYSLFNLPDSFPFTIDSVSGRILVTSPLDRELVSMYSFVVKARDSVTQAIGLALVQVTVGDANDNGPVISPSLPHIVTLPENFQLNSPFTFYTCTDNDQGSNSVVTFQLFTPNNATLPLTVDSVGAISLAQPLDFESEAQHNVTVICVDSGSPSLSSTAATLIVVVTGINEFPPVFENRIYTISISETTPAGEQIASIDATDSDEGGDNILQYTISDSSSTSYFTVDSTGMIRTTVLPLNATVTPLLRFTLRATDRGGLFDEVSVRVVVEDVNETPMFTNAESFLVITSTNQSVGSSLLTLTCFDIDLLGNNSLLFLQTTSAPQDLGVYLESSSASGLVTGNLLVNETLTAGSYEIVFMCSDNGLPRLADSISVTLRVEGVNSPPTFLHDPLVISVFENTMVGSYLVTVNASDIESDVRYDITGGNGLGTFDIDETTGDISLFLPLNFELTPSYTVIVTAYDSLTFNQMSSTSLVTIFVDNVNDLTPVVQPTGTQLITLSENTPLENIVQSYTCSDPDGTSTTLTISPSHPSSPFTLSPMGNVVLRSPLDYETAVSHSLTVTCTDMEVRLGEGVALSATAAIIVSVIPVNNHDPAIVSPSQFNVVESAPSGTVVGSVEATDSDGRGMLSYFTTSHTDVFVIDSTSGNITLIGTLDYESIQNYTLTVTVSDNDNIQGVSPRSTSTDITISTLDVNDNTPFCTSTLINTQLEIGTHPYTLLTTLSCSDIDSGDNGLLSYRFVETTRPQIQGGDFLLNQTTGELGFSGTISVSTTHIIDILVSDSSASSPLSSLVTVTVQVVATDSTRPRFLPGLFNVSISENTEASTVIFNGTILQEAIANSSGGAAVTYSIRPDSKHVGTFVINSASGDIILTNKFLIDYESDTQNYTLIVDALVGTNNASAIVMVFLTDYNDNMPRFTMAVYNGSVSENLPNGTFVLRVEASDRDSNENAQFLYSVESSVDLAVDPMSGDITTVREFDRETNERYSFVVLATDFGDPTLTGSAVVTVTVGDMNDNAPAFVSSIYIIDLDNLSPPGTHLVTLEVEDEDIVGTITFQINTDDQDIRDLFTVDSPDGILRQRAVSIPDDHRTRYNFTVAVSDGISMDTTTVIIYVASATRDTAIFEENVEGQTYNARDFLILQDFNVTRNALYVIEEGDVRNEFTISSTGILTTADVLDRELISQYTIKIRVIDEVTSTDVNLYVAITVLDQNDNAPSFDQNLYVFNASEGSYTEAAPLGNVRAIDLDEPGTNAAVIEYAIVGAVMGRSDFFSIDPVTGELFVIAGKILDREKDSNHTLVVRARDFGEPSPEVTSTTVLITLNDINDNDPEFVPLDVIEYFLLISFVEVTLPGTELNKFTALLPGGVLQEATFIEFTDPDSSSEVSATLEEVSGEFKYRLGKDIPNQVTLITNAAVTAKDNGTVVSLVLMDEPPGVEENSVTRNITIIVANQSIVIPPTKGLEPRVFFQTEIGIAVIVVICMLIVALVVLLCCLSFYCFLKIRREKDPLRNA